MRKFFFALISAFCAFGAYATEIALLADLHVTPGNANEEKLREVVAEINRSSADVVVVAGDLTNEGSDVQLGNVKSILDGLTKPVYVVPGNHEVNWSQSACKTFNDIWGDDRFVAEVDDIVLVGINCGPFMKMGDGHIKQEDLMWLDATLAERTKPGKMVVSVNHYPLLPDLDNVEDYISVLQKYPVVVHLCGHYHQFRKYMGGGIDCLINRALDMKNGNYGYSLIEVANDSVKQFDKHLGESPVLVNAFPVRKAIEPITPTVHQQSVLPQGVEVKLIYSGDASIFTRVALDENNVYFGTSLGEMKAISKIDGNEVWSRNASSAMLFSRPAVSDNHVIFPCADKRLLWLSKKNGFPQGVSASNGPYVADGIVEAGVLYQGGYKTFKAWNLNSRELLWSYDSIDNYCQASPVVSAGKILFGAWDTYLRCVDAATGKLLWKWNNGKSANMLGPGNCVPVVSGDRVIVVAPDRYMTALDLNTGKQIWRVKDKKVRESLGVSADGKVAYAKTMDGEIIAVSVNAKKYKMLWCVDAGFGYEHTPCVVVESKGVVYAASRTGMVAAIDPKKKKVIWSFKMGNSAVNGFEIDSNGDVYASLIEGKIYRISTAGR